MLRAFRPETVFTGSTGGLLVIDYRIDGKRGVLALGGVAALLLFFDVGARVLASNDEARFAVLARDILRHGTWLVPWLGETPYLNKPPLVAWLIALVSWPAGGGTESTAGGPALGGRPGVRLGPRGGRRRPSGPGGWATARGRRRPLHGGVPHGP